MPQKKSVSNEQIEELAATLATRTAMVKQLQVNPNYISMRMQTDAEFKAAFERGWARNPKNIKAVTSAPSPKQTAEVAEVTEAATATPTAATTDNQTAIALLQQLTANVREAVRLGNSTPARIAKFLRSDEESVKKVLNNLVKERIVERDFTDNETEYFLSKKGESTNPEMDKITTSLSQIKYQFSKHLCINTGLSIGTVVDSLDALIATGAAGSQYVGSINAYFLIENAPDGTHQPKGKLYLSGDGAISVRAEESRGVTNGLKKGDVVTPDTSNNQNRVLTLGGAVKEPYLQIDPEEVERLAEIDPSKDHIAAKLGIGLTQLSQCLIERGELRHARERGQKKNHAAQNAKQEAQNTPSLISEKDLKQAAEIAASFPPTVDDHKVIEEFIERRAALEQQAEEKETTKKQGESFYDHRSGPKEDVPTGWKFVEGGMIPSDDLTEEISASPRFSDILVQSERNGLTQRVAQGRESFETFVIGSGNAGLSGMFGMPEGASYDYARAASAKPSGSHKLLELESGANLAITFEGNIFDLSDDEQNLVSAVTKLFQNYQKEHQR